MFRQGSKLSPLVRALVVSSSKWPPGKGRIREIAGIEQGSFVKEGLDQGGESTWLNLAKPDPNHRGYEPDCYQNQKQVSRNSGQKGRIQDPEYQD